MEDQGIIIQPSELLTIINSCAKAGIHYETLGNLFSLLSTHTLYKEEKEKERSKEKEIEKKILSLIAGKKNVVDNITEEVKLWVRGTSGEFSIAQVYSELCVIDKKNKDTVRYALKKLCEVGVIESVGRKTGLYRKVNKEYTEQSWWEDEGSPLPLRYPLGVERFANVYPGNIILLEGSKSQGKSSFCFEFARLNQSVYPKKIQYQNIEMANSEIKERVKQYEEDRMWTETKIRDRLTMIRRTSDWADIIIPDAINIVDYLLEYSETFKLPNFIFDIHKKLTTGICLIAIQRDPLKPYPTGGRATRDIPRLVLSLIGHKIRFEDVKSFNGSVNPTGMLCKYKKVRWWKFIKNGEWQSEEDATASEKKKKYQDYGATVNDPDFVHEEDE
jgi:hypothetical protein